jgi:hypothetical protein
VLVVAQIAISFLILVAAGLFVQTLNNLHSVQLGYARENILLFSLNARQAGHRDPEIAIFYADLRKRFESIPGVSSATLSQSSIINAGRVGPAVRGPMKIGAVTIEDVRVLGAGPRFLTTMQIPILAGREIDDRDQAGSRPVAVISERLARTYFGSENPVGRNITLPGEKRDLEIVGVSANLRYGGLKNEEESAMTVLVAVSQFSADRMTYALRTAGDPLRFVQSVREIVREADSRIPVTNVATQAAEIDRTISRELTFAKLCTGFAVLALLTACVGLYGTMSYSVGAAGRRDWNPYGAGRATRRRGVDGSAPRSTINGGGTRDQRACRVECVKARSSRFYSRPSPMIRERWRWPVWSC